MDFKKAAEAGAHASTLDFSKAVQIEKGQLIDFSKANPNVDELRVELHWKGTADADAAVMLLGSDKKALKGLRDANDANSTLGMVWYNNLVNQGIVHSGDARTADDDPSSPEEVITISLKSLTDTVASVIVVASTFPEDDAGQGRPVPFGLVEECRVDVINDKTNEVLFVYEVSTIHADVTSVELLDLTKKDNNWSLASMDVGVGNSAQALGDIAKKYSLT